ncbi:hypothetical protein COY28_07035 [Candidatus Woesearchaeota archaeon CG_4_10_14_0_2_um_filter_57_5]|nr:MAG: hypothetical protein AUJ68_02470 [Candidatus Woesearchaeota archaeon CG1_02_57_44]PIZ48687.1 MAG: hypothetical protein COY28_07035 [Candidatus Woesearchaeota archaeon CG_4_10_14_0_2_um_filter_57_5]
MTDAIMDQEAERFIEQYRALGGDIGLAEKADSARVVRGKPPFKAEGSNYCYAILPEGCEEPPTDDGDSAWVHSPELQEEAIALFLCLPKQVLDEQDAEGDYDLAHHRMWDYPKVMQAIAREPDDVRRFVMSLAVAMKNQLASSTWDMAALITLVEAGRIEIQESDDPIDADIILVNGPVTESKVPMYCAPWLKKKYLGAKLTPKEEVR